MDARINALPSLVVAYCVRRWLQDSSGRRAFVCQRPYKLNGGDKCATTGTVLHILVYDIRRWLALGCAVVRCDDITTLAGMP